MQPGNLMKKHQVGTPYFSSFWPVFKNLLFRFKIFAYFNINHARLWKSSFQAEFQIWGRSRAILGDAGGSSGRKLEKHVAEFSFLEENLRFTSGFLVFCNVAPSKNAGFMRRNGVFWWISAACPETPGEPDRAADSHRVLRSWVRTLLDKSS